VTLALRLLGLVAVGGCGRVSFDAIATGDAGGITFG